MNMVGLSLPLAKMGNRRRDSVAMMTGVSVSMAKMENCRCFSLSMKAAGVSK